jgi:hypothetical protein
LQYTSSRALVVNLSVFAKTLYLLVVLASTANAQQSPLAVPPSEDPDEESATVAVQKLKPELERPTVWGEPTEVAVTIYVIDVDEVDSAQQSFAASVYLEAHWNSPFLKHEGPGPVYHRVTDVWTPRLVTVNQQAAWSAFPEYVEIQPDGDVVYRQKVWARFSQPLDLRDFPLDRQNLEVHVAAAGLLQKEVKFVPYNKGEESGIAERFSLPDFDVLSWEAVPMPYPPDDENGVAGFRMRVEVQRQVMYFLVKVILPLCLIVIISWAPRWIDPEQIGTNIGVSTTAFLTLVAYLFATNVLLPRVSYVTRLDRFILLSTIMVFLCLIQTVMNIVLVGKKKTEFATRIDRWSRFVYPIFLLIVLLVSFVI